MQESGVSFLSPDREAVVIVGDRYQITKFRVGAGHLCGCDQAAPRVGMPAITRRAAAVRLDQAPAMRVSATSPTPVFFTRDAIRRTGHATFPASMDGHAICVHPTLLVSMCETPAWPDGWDHVLMYRSTPTKTTSAPRDVPPYRVFNLRGRR